VEHPGYSGEYVVADTVDQIRGRRIDIWTPSASEAMRFGRRNGETDRAELMAPGDRSDQLGLTRQPFAECTWQKDNPSAFLVCASEYIAERQITLPVVNIIGPNLFLNW